MARSWLVLVVMTGGLLPALSMLVSVLHEPYVSIGRDSATPAIIATFVVALFVSVLAFWCGTASWPIPEIAGIAFLPAALLVPAVLGIQGTATQRAALETLAEATMFAAGTTVFAWSLPRGLRLLVPPAAFGAQTLALWLAGRGPSIPASSGGIVTTLFVVTLILTGALVLALPLYAAWIKHMVERAEEMARPRRSSAGGDAPRQ
jgi:hypothetical protein